MRDPGQLDERRVAVEVVVSHEDPAAPPDQPFETVAGVRIRSVSPLLGVPGWRRWVGLALVVDPVPLARQRPALSAASSAAWRRGTLRWDVEMASSPTRLPPS
jgi:hypothetical protein